MPEIRVEKTTDPPATEGRLKWLNRLMLWEWLFYAAVLFGAIYLLAPQNLPVLVLKLLYAAVAAIVAHRLDRAMFPYGRPDKLVDLGSDGEWGDGESRVFASAMLRRAIIVAAAIIGVELGV